MEDNADSDEDASSDETDEDQAKEKLPSPQIAKLKVPGLGKKKKKRKIEPSPKPSFKSSAVGSVWLNPFENAEMKKQSVLEKHVKMTEVVIPTGKKAKICKMFKLKGQCRFGKHCKYSHDIQTISSSQHHPQEKPGPVGPAMGSNQRSRFQEKPPPPKAHGFMGTVNTLRSQSSPGPSRFQERKMRQQEHFMANQDDQDGDDDKFLAHKKRKVRVGVSESLVPPKRALMALSKQREEERPWTLDTHYNNF